MPFLVLVLINILSILLGEHWLQWVLWVASFPIYIVLAVNTHRLYLLGPNKSASSKFVVWGRRETQFLSRLLVLVIGGSLLVLGLVWVAPIIGLLGYIFISYVGARLSLVFPATAIDDPLTFSGSWELSNKHQFLIVGIVLGVPILFTAIERLLEVIPNSSILVLLVGSCLGVITIGCLSKVFQQVMNENTGS